MYASVGDFLTQPFAMAPSPPLAPHSSRAYESCLAEYSACKAEYACLKRSTPSSRPALPTPKLGLLERLGPLSFRVCELGAGRASFHVRLGEVHRCSCCSAPRCPHIAWVLTSALRLPPATARRSGLSHAELQRALEATPLPLARPRARSRPPLDGESVSWLLGLSEYEAYLLTLPPPEDRAEHKSTRRPLAADESCPICMEEITEEDSSRPGVLVFCAKSCGRSLHAECLRAWAQHHVGELSCPMCRASWGELPPSVAEAEAEVAARRRQMQLRKGLSAVAQRQVRLLEPSEQPVRKVTRGLPLPVGTA